MRQLITDLQKIRRVARRNSQRNKDFGNFLNEVYSQQVLAGTDEEWLQFFKQQQREIAEQIDCLQCANCCQRLDIVIVQEDIFCLSEGIGISIENFIHQYVQRKRYFDGEDEYELREKPCPFLNNRECLYYQFRPQICRRYPEDYTSFFSWLFVMFVNYEICPIIFNLFEQIKQYYWSNDAERLP